jgi:hypothetical protein
LLRAAPIVPVIVWFVVAAMVHGMAWAQAPSRTRATAGKTKLHADFFEPSNRPYRPPTNKQRFRRYANWMFSPYSLASVTFVSGLH